MAVVIVCGGRYYGDEKAVFELLDSLNREVGISLLRTGGCTGADRIAEHWAVRNEVAYESVAPDWSRWGRSAGPRRNQEMLDRGCDLVVAFPGGAGTADMLGRARRANVGAIVKHGGSGMVATTMPWPSRPMARKPAVAQSAEAPPSNGG